MSLAATFNFAFEVYFFIFWLFQLLTTMSLAGNFLFCSRGVFFYRLITSITDNHVIGWQLLSLLSRCIFLSFDSFNYWQPCHWLATFNFAFEVYFFIVWLLQLLTTMSLAGNFLFCSWGVFFYRLITSITDNHVIGWQLFILLSRCIFLSFDYFNYWQPCHWLATFKFALEVYFFIVWFLQLLTTMSFAVNF